MPKLCEKCGRYDARPELTVDSRCPRCGVVYAKLAAEPPSPASSLQASEPDTSWPALAPAELGLSLFAICVLVAILLTDDDGFVVLLDHANLVFHEAGHLVFGVLGSTLGLYGGTLGQFVFPIGAGLSFWHRRQAVGIALSGVWLFENFLNVARYMADARAQQLPLVGGGEHDWYHIFSRWGILAHDTDIAAFTRTLGWLGILGCLFWLIRQYSGTNRRPKRSSF